MKKQRQIIVIQRGKMGVRFDVNLYAIIIQLILLWSFALIIRAVSITLF